MENVTPNKPAKKKRASSTSTRQFYFKWAVFFLICVLVFVFFAFYAKQFQKSVIKVDLKGRTVSIETSQVKVPAQVIRESDSKKNYVDSGKGFSFELPTGQDWSKPAQFSGLNGALEAKGISLNPEVRDALKTEAANSPLAPLFDAGQVIRITQGVPIDVEVTNESTTQSLELIIESLKKNAQQNHVELTDSDVINYRRQAFVFEKLKFANEFMLTIYDKSKLSGIPFKLT